MSRSIAAFDLAKDNRLAVGTLPAGGAEIHGVPLATPLPIAAGVIVETAPACLREVAPSRSFYAAHGKRLFDILLGIPLLLLASPVIALAVIAVVLTSGWPPFYASTRVGKDGRSFRMWKIRTMRRDADQAMRRWQETHPELAEEYALFFKVRKDPRITSVGNVLRHTSIDELPQLWNVIRGDMSIVGPRPYLLPELSRFPETQAALSFVRPGLTGPWQVSGRNRLAPPERMDMDRQYVISVSLAKDVSYFLSTFPAVWRSEGI